MLWTYRTAPTSWITAALAVIFVSSTWGLTLEPLSHVFGSSPTDRVHTYRVTNTQEREIAVRISVTTRNHSPQGREIRGDASNDWVIFPSRVVLAPGQSQAVRVQYTGAGGLQRERAFRIIAEQLPVNTREGEQRSGINVLFRYEGSMYVRSGRFSPEVLLVHAERHFEEGIFQGILVRFGNQGSTHAILHNLQLTLTLRNESGEQLDQIVFAEEDLKILGGRNILAGAILEEVLPLPETWSRGVYDVQHTVTLLD